MLRTHFKRFTSHMCASLTNQKRSLQMGVNRLKMVDNESSVLNTINNGIQRITFNRPSKKNAITPQMYETLINIINESSTNKNVIALVFTGNGEFYSSGNDMKSSIQSQSTDNESNDPIELTKGFIDSLILYPKLLIAVVNGPAIGIAMTTLGLFDIVYASDKVYFQTPFSQIGFTAEGCSTYTFPIIFGTSKASEILFLNYKLSAKEALERGFVSKLFNHKDIDKIWAKLEEISLFSIESIKGSKKLMRRWHQNALLEANKEEIKVLKETVMSDEFAQYLIKYLNSVNMKKSKF